MLKQDKATRPKEVPGIRGAVEVIPAVATYGHSTVSPIPLRGALPSLCSLVGGRAQASPAVLASYADPPSPGPTPPLTSQGQEMTEVL